jgi:hypothetical protein
MASLLEQQQGINMQMAKASEANNRPALLCEAIIALTGG